MQAETGLCKDHALLLRFLVAALATLLPEGRPLRVRVDREQLRGTCKDAAGKKATLRVGGRPLELPGKVPSADIRHP